MVATETSDFTEYEPTSTNPGWVATVVVVAISILISATLPLLLWYNYKYIKPWSEQRRLMNARDLQETHTGGTSEEDNNDHGSADDDDDDEGVMPNSTGAGIINPLNKYPLTTATSSGNGNKSNNGSQCHSGTGSTSGGLGGLGGLHQKRGPGSVISDDGYSSIDEGSTISQQIAKNVLNVRAHKVKRTHVPKVTPATTALTPFTSLTVPVDPDGHYHLGGGNNLNDERSEAMSVMSKLDDDAVSARDAVDAVENVAAAANGRGGDNSMQNSSSSGSQNNNNNKSRFDLLLEIADLDHEMKQLWSLTIPYSIQGLFEGVFSTADAALIGHFIGTKEANAYITVTILIEFTATFTYGFAEAVGTLCPQADGAGNHVLMGRYLQLAIIFYLLGTIPGMVLWSCLTERAVLWFGFDQETAEIAQRYAYPFLVITFFNGIDDNLVEYFNVTDHEKYCTVYYMISHAAATLALVIMTVVLEWDDLVLVGIVQAFVAFVFMAGNFTWGKYMGWLDSCWEGLFKTFSLKDRRAVHTMMITAIPLGISWILTYGEWEVMTIFAGFMGPAEVVAWGLIGYIWEAFEELTEGLSSAAETRVAFRMGAGKPKVAKLCAYKGMYIGVVVSVFATALLFIIAPYLPGWVTPDPTLQRMIFDLIPLIGFGQISMSIGAVCWSIIGAQGRMRLATFIEILTSWGLAIPISAVLIFVFNWNLIAPCAALVVSYSVGGVATGFIVMTSDWEALSKRVIAYSGKAGGDDGATDYDDYDWVDLPKNVQKAAKTLGYSKKIWDTNGDAESSKLDWNQLTPVQQEAAVLMGYTEEKWDGGSDSDSSDSSSESENGKGKKDDEKNVEKNMQVPPLDIDDMSWDKLPPTAKEAAAVLGINKHMWDADEEPESSDKYWKDLTPAEQKAAAILGYDEKKWNTESESDSESDSSDED